jgi:Intra-flagellar transport protein 57
MKKYKDTIVKEMSGTKGQLESLHTNIGQSMEKINARERFLNNQLEPQLAEYRKLQVSQSGQHFAEAVTKILCN